ncbi:hypothetical protein LTR15_005253 [Elasticomyces elasticus]|nr:hypothetical protein LTR15_005253 [Elasticomyces elasticus]
MTTIDQTWTQCIDIDMRGVKYTPLEANDIDSDPTSSKPTMERLKSNDSYTMRKVPSQTISPSITDDTEAVGPSNTHQHNTENPTTDRVYPSRFYGLILLVLLNIMISWSWLTFASLSTTSASYFGVSEASINWLSTGFLFAFIPMAPLVILTLNKGGPKRAIIISSALVLVGNWIRYLGTRYPHRPSPLGSGTFGVVMLGQILIGFAQPFVLAAPTRYSALWFSDTGRVSATAFASLANPFGAALGQLIGPLWADTPSQIPRMVLYTSILSSAITVLAPFTPAAPPTPPSAIAASEKLDLRAALRVLPRNKQFWLLLLPFSIYVGFFNACSSLLNQIFAPYGFTETEAGIAGGLLIVVGLIASAIVSPFVDRTKNYLLTIKILVPIIASSYLALIFMPATRSVIGPYIICSLLGASSFSLLPCALEYLVVITHPVSPEITSVICWTGGQLLGAVFIVVMTALRGGEDSKPQGEMGRALVFEAVVAWVGVPFALVLGLGWAGRGRGRGGMRLEEEEGG